MKDCDGLEYGIATIFSVYSMEGNKESLQSLCEMPFELFIDLREHLTILSVVKEYGNWQSMKDSGQI